MDLNQLFRTSWGAAGAGVLLLVLSACASDNSVNQFLSNASDQINSMNARIPGNQASAAGCRPNPYAPAVADPRPLFAGQSFTYRRGERHTGKITYAAGGAFSWENEDGTKAGTGSWSTQGAKWCESYNASAHNEAVSIRCWPVIRAGNAICFGVTRLVPSTAAVPPG